VVSGQRMDGIYFLGFDIIAPTNEIALVARTLDEWHKCLGHISTKVIKTMAREKLVDDFEIKGDGKAKTCEACAINKGHSVPHKDRSTERINKPGSSLHLDTSGPQPTPSLNGSNYFVLCKDEASAFRKVVFVESKSEIPLEVKKIVNQVSLETRNQV